MVRRGRRRILVGLAVAMFLGIAVYFRLWAIHYSISSDDAELLRRQFDLANKEAMDESAEWRLRFDEEADKASKCAKELDEIKDSIGKKGDSTGFEEKLMLLQKENAALLKQVETLKMSLWQRNGGVTHSRQTYKTSLIFGLSTTSPDSCACN